MKVSLNWVKQYTNIKLSIDQVSDKIGSQLGAIEGIENIGNKYRDITIAKVVDVKPHPNADKLKVCLIDDAKAVKSVKRNAQGLIEVVCGAPNVKTGMNVAWLPPGAIVPSSFNKNALKLEVREIRGIKSSGMLASPSELALGDNHDGILVVDKGQSGDDFSDAYQLDDYIIDIENKMFTHRPDCFGMLGVAREVAGINRQKFISPKWYNQATKKLESNVAQLPINVINEIPDLVPRFMAIVIKDVVVGPSPVWLQTMLSRVGVRPINNVVDTTNYMMLLSGQPLHAYDYDKVKAQDNNSSGANMVIRLPKPEEELSLLGGKQIKLGSEDILIASATKPIALGGVMGGAGTEVEESTKNIILECATFDMYTIRRTSMAHGLFTDAVTRFSKGQSPLQNSPIIVKCAEIIIELSGTEAKVASRLIDINQVTSQPNPIYITSEFINSRLGLSLSATVIKKLLENVEFKVKLSATKLSVSAPFWRTDIDIAEDIVEEVGRLYGYDNLNLSLPRRSLTPPTPNDLLNTKSQIRQLLAGAGANEVLTYSFIHGGLLKKSGQDSDKAYQLANALSPDLQYYRLSLTPSLLEKVYSNLRADFVRSDDNEFALFELNRVHNKVDKDEEGLPKEANDLCLVYVADEKTAKRKYSGAPYFIAKNYLNFLLAKSTDQAGISLVPHNQVKASDLDKSEWAKQLVRPFEPSRSAVLVDEIGAIRGVIGEYNQNLRRALKLPDFCSGFEVDISLFGNSDADEEYSPIPRFPKVQQDITLKVASSQSYSEVFELMTAELEALKPTDTIITIEPLDIFQGKNDSTHKHISFRIWISAYDRTLTAESINQLLDRVALKLKQKLGTERI